MNRTLLILLMGVLAVGCTPQAVRDLSEKTAANSAFVANQLNHLREDSWRVTEMRAANLARLHGANAEVRERYEFDLELVKRTDRTNLKLITELNEWSEKVGELLGQTASIEEDFKARLLDKTTDLQTSSDELSQIAEILAGMAKKEGMKTRAKFYLGFVKQIADEVKTKREAGQAAGDRAVGELEAKSALRGD